LRVDRDGNLYAGTESGGLFRTSSDGEDWVRVNLPVNDGGIGAIIVDANSAIFIANDVHGVYESIDNGGTWFRLSDGLGDTSVYCLGYLPNGRLVAGTAKGEISITGDSAPTWRRKADLGRPVTSLLVRSSEEIYASAWAGGIYRFGETSPAVTAVNPGLEDLFINSLYSGGTGYIFAGSRNAGIFRTDQEHIFWQGVGGSTVSREVITFRGSLLGELFAGTGNGIFVSTDLGLTWTKLDRGLGSREIRALAVTITGVVFAGSADGVYRSIRPQ